MADKIKFQLEFITRSSSKILFNCLSTPDGLSEWFSDNVNIKNDVYTFYWDNSEEDAKLLNSRAGEYVRFQWEDDEGEDWFWELRIKPDQLSKGHALIVTDFAEEDELEEAEALWTKQINRLLQVIGS